MNDSFIAKTLRPHLRDYGLRRVARDTGVNVTTIALWLDSGRREPSLADTKKLAAAVGYELIVTQTVKLVPIRGFKVAPRPPRKRPTKRNPRARPRNYVAEETKI